MDRHEDIWDQLTGYALGELSGEARGRVELHLAGCAGCAIEARELSQGVDAIGLSTPPMAPPSGVRAQVLAALPPRDIQQGAPAGRFPSISTTRGISQRWLAAAAVLVVVLGGMLALSQQRVARLLDERRTAESEVARLTGDAAAVAGQADLAVAILTATDMRRIDLQGLDASRDATARAYWSGTKGLLIVADRLPVPPPGRIYQVWLIGAGAPGPVSAGLIDGQSGRGMLIVAAPAGAAGRSVTVAVTDEPNGGLPAPSGSKHLVGSM
ncbi:MAG: anti-sigma factor [Acidobacteriota bacterium]|nr:anti-sigma factor [Acidobacteriota bacterium]